MHFHKYPHPANFEFPAMLVLQGEFKTRKGTYCIHARAGIDDVYSIRITGEGWNTNDSQAGLCFRGNSEGLEGRGTKLNLAADGMLLLQTKDGTNLLAASPGRFFGQSGNASIFEFQRQKGDQFYGFGEKWTGFEHSGKTTKFWNTDVWGDFPPDEYINGHPDPVYVSVPYVILKRGNTYLGLLLDNPHATFVSTNSRVSIANQMEINGLDTDTFHLGAEQGQPNLYILVGPSLAELTRKLQTLVGVTPLPPAWALGYQQCRFGYESEADLNELDARFREHGIPADGLWLDIGYMDRYKVFTFAEKHFSDPVQAVAKLGAAGHKVVPILDPGVKRETGYCVYERGRQAEVFCKNPQGGEYVGLVWPGMTVFPDFSLEKTRQWWAKEVAEFARVGVYGAWLDMNDPATGPADNLDMLFDHGRKSHSAFHNQYALGMAMASRQGFLDAHPTQRPFLLCRSGSTGTSRYTAIWTGDNFSNYHHLRNGIATTLNLALSGIPFNGNDAGGFGGDAAAPLICDWFKAGFLFPVFRNHTIFQSRQQEPWAFDEKTLVLLRRYIRLRYRLRPYLYQLFVEQERTGEAILRPLFYDFEDSAALPLGLVDDQFMVGPCIMQAPFLVEKQRKRKVVLPGAGRWYSVMEDLWFDGGQSIKTVAKAATTPVYVRDGSILPMARLAPEENAFHANRADFRIFLSDATEAKTSYCFDDGATFGYRNGERSQVEVVARRKGNSLAIEITSLSDGYGKGDFTFTSSRDIDHVTINRSPARKTTAQGVPFGTGKTKTWEP